MKQYIALNSVSFSGKISGVRYSVDVGRSYTPNVEGDFDGVIGTIFEAEQDEATQVIEQVEPIEAKSEPTPKPKRKPKKSK